jgi:hypothetical protein
MIIRSRFCAPVGCGLTSQVLDLTELGHHMEFVTHDYTQQILRTCWLLCNLTGLTESNKGDQHMGFVTHDYTHQILRTCWLRSDLTGTSWILQSWTTTWSL